MRHAIDWGELRAIEPYPGEVRAHAAALAAAYNDPRNAPLLGHTAALGEDDVLGHYASLDAAGAHPFLLLRGDALAGDGDLRGVTAEAAEFAFLIASPAAQGQGLGTRFATMIHAFAFARLGLARVYASIIPANVASRRVFEKLGYALDASPAARAYADDDGDLVMSLDRATFTHRHAAALADVRVTARA